jgi:hypothetical protein
MEQQASAAVVIPGNSIRLVQDLPSSRPTTANSQKALNAIFNQEQPASTASSNETLKAISVPPRDDSLAATKLFGPRAQLSKSTSADPMKPLPAITGEQNIRPTKSAGVLHPKALEHQDTFYEPIVSESQKRQSGTASDSGSNVPEFRQSKRWNRYQAQVESKAAAQNSLNDESMRKASCDQQRALPKTSLQLRTPLSPVIANAFSDTASLIQAQGLCGPCSVPTRQLIKPVHLSHPPSFPTKWVTKRLTRRRLARRQQGNKTPSQTSRRSSVEVSNNLRRVRSKRQIRTVKGVGDLRRKAGYSGSRSRLAEDEDEKIVNLDSVSLLDPVTKEVRSPVPTLHDPEKAKRFSQECEALLSNVDFDKDWLATDKGAFGSINAQTAESTKMERPSSSKSRPKSRGKALADTPAASTAPTPAPIVEKKQSIGLVPNPPRPPVRTSSKAGVRLAFGGRAGCIPILPNFPYGSDLPTGDSTISVASRANHPIDFDTPSKKPSSSHRAEQATRTPRTVASTDTLTAIEAHLQESVHTNIAEKLKQNTAFIVGASERPATASGQPPERPLPALPPPERDLSIHAPTSRYNPHGVHTGSRKDIEATNLAQSAGSAPAPSIGRPTSRETAASKGLVVDTSSVDSTAEVSPDLKTDRSTSPIGAHSSFRRSMQFRRHNLASIRPERSRLLKKLVKEDLAKVRRISEEDETRSIRSNASKPPEKALPPIPQHAHRPSVDPLDQFPSVPVSRPNSRTSMGTRRAHSRSRSNARHSSKASSTRRRGAPQHLATSEIKVLVDANPITGRFRAGAISPSPSLLVSSREASPKKIRRRLSKSSISTENIVKDPEHPKKSSTKKPSRTSLRSQGGSRLALPAWTHGDAISDSDDEVNPQVGGTLLKKAASSPRGFDQSGQQIPDMKYYIETIKKMQQQIRQQERKLREQAEEIHRNSRIVAPRPNVLPVYDKGFEVEGLLDRELESLKAARWREQERRGWRAAKEKQTAMLRPSSYLSSASATTNISTGSKSDAATGSVEGSMTDPLEFENLLLPQPEGKGHTRQIGSSASAPGGLAATITHTADGSRKERRPGSKGSMTAVMHHPPPVAMILPRTRYGEKGEPEGWFDEEAGGREREGADRVLKSADQMDRAIDAMNSS